MSLSPPHKRQRLSIDDVSEPDYDSWFNTPTANVFTTAAFTTASNKSVLIPSAEALEKAKLKMRTWVADIDPDESIKENTPTKPFQSPTVALSPRKNVLNSPQTPSPMGFSRPNLTTPSKSSFSASGSKPFKPPLKVAAVAPSPLNPNRTGYATPLQPYRVPPTRVGFVSSAPTITPMRPRARPATTPRFVTPFKPGMHPSERSTPAQKNDLTPLRVVPPAVVQYKSFFSLEPDFKRTTLAESGLYPGQYTDYELNSMGINTQIINSITPTTAQYFYFHSTPHTNPHLGDKLGPAQALEDLLQRGCTLATKAWVDNHWCLILWKLAGMVKLDPHAEADPRKKRWCWDEVIRQLLYRYERELNRGIRPALRKITTQDAPSTFPLTLCISNIIYPSSSSTVQLELTDGWYRLLATPDAPLTRAICSGLLRVGRKLGIAGARLISEKKEPVEVLDGYGSVRLELDGNSVGMMGWETKMGFMAGPWVRTLGGLSPDGGLVAVLDLVVVKVHPIAFLEFVETPEGETRKEGPRTEPDERKEDAKWRARWEVEASKLRSEFDKRVGRYEAYIERLERKAGRFFPPRGADAEGEGCPERVYEMFDQLEYGDGAARVMKEVGAEDAGWLAWYARTQVGVMREGFGEELEREMRAICPPRSVRSFRVLVMQDARGVRKPSNRTAQVTVWDVLKITPREGSKAGEFKVGERFLVTNLMPSRPRSWMDNSPGSEIFLTTRPNTKWTYVKTPVVE